MAITKARDIRAALAKLDEGRNNYTNPFIVEGIEPDGSRTELASFDNSAEARAFLARYTAREDAGGWNLIEIYDTRGEDAERLAFWEREEPTE